MRTINTTSGDNIFLSHATKERCLVGAFISGASINSCNVKRSVINVFLLFGLALFFNGTARADAVTNVTISSYVGNQYLPNAYGYTPVAPLSLPLDGSTAVQFTDLVGTPVTVTINTFNEGIKAIGSSDFSQWMGFQITVDQNPNLIGDYFDFVLSSVTAGGQQTTIDAVDWDEVNTYGGPIGPDGDMLNVNNYTSQTHGFYTDSVFDVDFSYSVPEPSTIYILSASLIIFGTLGRKKISRLRQRG